MRPASLGTSRVNNRFLFQGQLYDAQLGAYSMRAREYKPAWGRFLSVDPAGLAFGDNRYAFVDGRPLTMMDPSGLCGKQLYNDASRNRFDWSSTGRLDDYFRQSYGLTPQYALEMSGVRSTAASANWDRGNYGLAAVNGFFGISDAVGSTFLGRTVGETAVKVGAGLLVGGALNAFFKWAAATAPVFTPLAAGTTGAMTTAAGTVGGAVGADEVVAATGEADATLARPQYVPTVKVNEEDGTRLPLPLPRTEDGQLAPSSTDPHTQIGWRDGRKDSYIQTREFGPNGQPIKQVDWTDHGRPQLHTDPHVHDYIPNPTGGSPQVGPARPPLPGEL